MNLLTEIKFLQKDNQYQLLLPEQATELLGLKAVDGTPLPIMHESKMKLEWLSLAIIKKFDTLSREYAANNKRLDLRKRWAAIILLAAVILGSLSSYIVRITHFNKLYITVTAFTIGIISCLQLLKYFALGVAGRQSDLSADQELLELKEQIIRDFSD